MNKQDNTTIVAGVTPEQDRGLFRRLYQSMSTTTPVESTNDAAVQTPAFVADDENEKGDGIDKERPDQKSPPPSSVTKRTHPPNIVSPSAVKRNKKDTDEHAITAADAVEYLKLFKNKETIALTWKSLRIPTSGVRNTLRFTYADDVCTLRKQVPVYLTLKNKQGGTDYNWSGFQAQHVATCRLLGWETSFGDAKRTLDSIKVSQHISCARTVRGWVEGIHCHFSVLVVYIENNTLF